MRWGETYDQRNDREKDFKKWVYGGHKWFAWRPVRLTSGQRVWFEGVWRFGQKRSDSSLDSREFRWKYRPLEEKILEKLDPPPTDINIPNQSNMTAKEVQKLFDTLFANGSVYDKP